MKSAEARSELNTGLNRLIKTLESEADEKARRTIPFFKRLLAELKTIEAPVTLRSFAQNKLAGRFPLADANHFSPLAASELKALTDYAREIPRQLEIPFEVSWTDKDLSYVEGSAYLPFDEIPSSELSNFHALSTAEAKELMALCELWVLSQLNGPVIDRELFDLAFSDRWSSAKEADLRAALDRVRFEPKESAVLLGRYLDLLISQPLLQRFLVELVLQSRDDYLVVFSVPVRWVFTRYEGGFVEIGILKRGVSLQGVPPSRHH